MLQRLKEKLEALSSNPQTTEDLRLLESVERKSRKLQKRMPISLVDLSDNYTAANEAVSRNSNEAFGLTVAKWINIEAIHSFQQIAEVISWTRKYAREGQRGLTYLDAHLFREGVRMGRTFGIDERPDEFFADRILDYFDKVANFHWLDNNLRDLERNRGQYTKEKTDRLEHWIRCIASAFNVDVTDKLVA